MQADPGTRLGPYEILSLIGAGGMGEVYRARDTRLGREVAIKLLAPALAADAAAVTRFEREARAVAALSHPNILALHDFGRENGTAYAVMELLDGSSLRERLRGGALPARKAIEYGVQIADALAAAHERGIIHRDIKPDNIFITNDGRVKILDFGLAHAIAPAGDPAASATMAKQADISRGLLLGTAGYMSPEQLRGAEADQRSDIFAFGAVLYEMLSGRQTFGGETFADAMHAILHDDPPPIGGGVPQYLDSVVRKCLEKQPGERFQNARDVAFALQVAPAVSGATRVPVRRRRTFAAIIAAALVVAVAAFAFVRYMRRDVAAPPRSAPVMRFGIYATPTWSDSASISPDGSAIIYTSSRELNGDASSIEAVTDGRFWVRRLDAVRSRPLPRSGEAHPLFFWSPDSRFVGYRLGTAVMISDLSGSSPRVLLDTGAVPQGVAWGKDDLLVALPDGIYRLPPNGGTQKIVLRSEPDKELWRGSPSFLPDGKRFLYTVRKKGSSEDALETRVASLEGRELGTIGTAMTGAMYADGCLLFGSGGALWAQRFDLDRLTLTGDRVQLAAAVSQDWRAGRLSAKTSDTGILVYRAAQQVNFQFAIVNRFGRRVRDIGSPDTFSNFSVSPDEGRIISSRVDPLTGRGGLSLIDMKRGVTSVVSSSSDNETADDPTWMPDGERVAFMHGSRIVTRSANGGPERTIVDANAFPDSFTSDGKFLIYGMADGSAFLQWAVDITTPGAKPIPLVTTAGATLVDEGRFSPNGKWLALHANITGSTQVTVMPFPPTGASWQISEKGGVQPRWSADGNELFYLDPGGHLMSVRMPDSDPRRASAPEPLFSTGLVPSDALDQYAPVRDGFVLRLPTTAAGDSAAVQVVVNWCELVR